MSTQKQAIPGTGWNPPETAPKTGKVFLITTAGPQMDFCYWDKQQQAFIDYFHRQHIPPEFPYMIGWRFPPEYAIVCATERDTRVANGWKARGKA